MLEMHNSGSALSHKSRKSQVFVMYKPVVTPLHWAHSTSILATFPGKEETCRLGRDWLV